MECEALNTLGVATCYLEDETVGLAQIQAALALAKACGDSHQQMRGYWNLAVCAAEAGRWEEAIGHDRTAIEALPRLGLAHLLPELYGYEAEDLMILGRWDEAQAVVDEAARRFPTRKDEATLIELVVAKGDVGEARRLLAAASERDVFVDKEDQAMVMVNLADLETWEGNLAAAREAADAALRHVLRSDRPIAAARALRVALRCEADAAEEARARRLPGELDRAQRRAATHRRRMLGLLARPGPDTGWKRVVRALAAIADGEWSRVWGSPDPAAWANAIRATSDLSMVYALRSAPGRCAT